MLTNRQRLGLGLLFASLGLASGCGSTPVDTVPYCATDSVNICEPPGFSYVSAAATRSDACPTPMKGPCGTPMSLTTATLTAPDTSKVCMKGSVAGREGFAWLLFHVARWNRAGTDIVTLMNAKAQGITELRFTVDTPPTEGITFVAATAHQTHCATPPDCLGEFWSLMTGPRSNVVRVITESGPVSAPFSDFRRTDPNQVMDTTALADFVFILGAGDYDFCISDFKFVDAQGQEVSPPPLVDGGASGPG